MQRNIIEEGIRVTQSLFFRVLKSRAKKIIDKPLLVLKLLDKMVAKLRKQGGAYQLSDEVWTGLQSIFRLLRAYVMGEYRAIGRTNVVILVASVLYFVSPWDLIPDIFPMLGLVDDFGLIVWLLGALKEELDRFSDWEQSGEAVQEELPPPTFSRHIEIE